MQKQDSENVPKTCYSHFTPLDLFRMPDIFILTKYSELSNFLTTLNDGRFGRPDEGVTCMDEVGGRIIIIWSGTKVFSFKPVTARGYYLRVSSVVSLKIYNILGQEVMTLLDQQILNEGVQGTDFDGSKFASGVYYYRLIARPPSFGAEVTLGRGAFTAVKKDAATLIMI